MNQLIPTFTGTLAGETQALVNARDLHTVLGSKQDFSNWIKIRIESCGFIENEEYSINLSNRPFGVGKPRKDYHLSVDMAKELALVENNEQGKKARRYFIDMEKVARQEIPAFLRRGPAAGQVEALQAVALQKPRWAALKRYYELKLTSREMGTLLGCDPSTVRKMLKEMSACGLVDYRPNPLLATAKSKQMTKGVTA